MPFSEALTAQWVQSGDRIQAVVIRNVTWVQLDLDRTSGRFESSKAMPCQWAVNAVNTLLSPQLKGQFHGDNHFSWRLCKLNSTISVFFLFCRFGFHDVLWIECLGELECKG